MNKISWIFPVIFILVSSCKPLNTKSKYEKLRYEAIQKTLNQSLKQSYQQLDLGFERVVNYAKSQNNSKASLEKISSFYRIQKNYFSLKDIILKCIETLNTGDFKDNPNLFLTSEHPFSASSFKKSLDKYSQFLKVKYKKYLPDTTLWSKRYLKQFTNNPQKTIPRFEYFYLKGTNKEEAIHILKIFQLAIAQEELAIQQKIINEK